MSELVVSEHACIPFLPGQYVETDPGDEKLVSIQLEEHGAQFFRIVEQLESLPGAGDLGLQIRFGIVNIVGIVAETFKNLRKE